jgi:uncharacterized protein with FMN-binding domain
MTPVKSNLVALGTAAVVAVYSAGYMRTREAAERFAIEDSQRRAEHERRTQAPPVAPPPATSETKKDTSAAVASRANAAATPKHTETKAAPRPRRATPNRVDSVSAPVAEVAARPAEPAPPVSTPAPVTAAPPAGMTFKVTPPASADTTAAEDKPLKDGVYSGWGRSRHGDIEATVAIKDGKITEAFISQCLTQYSCSWVAALPPQVVARQSAEVDYVSGATQSTNAFYYAVIAALKKAK